MIKEKLRKLLLWLRIDVTKNLKYDRLTSDIIKRQLKKSSCCVDVGCHKGEILDLFLACAPEGQHYAFEPIPSFFQKLKERFSQKANIYPFALSDKHEESSFHFVKNAPAYSGIRRRKYLIKHPDIEEIRVDVRTLDEIIPKGEKIDLIKIDVEGGELGVLKGATQLLKRNKPILIFECGKGASEFYGSTPQDIFHFICEDSGMKMYTLPSYVGQKVPLTLADFERCFQTGQEYYFVAGTEI